MEKYNLKLNHVNKYSPVYAPILFLIGAALLIISLKDIKTNWLIPLLLLYFSVRAVIHFFKYRHKPVEINYNESKVILRELFKKEIELDPKDITEIELNKKNEFIIKTENQKIIGLNGFKKFIDFAEDLKKEYENIKLVGF